MASDQKIVVTGQGIGFCGLLFIVLLLLKVGIVETAAVGWSWWWIFAPFWGPLALIVGILLLTGVIILLCLLCYLLGKFIILLSGWIVDFVIKWSKKRKLNKTRRLLKRIDHCQKSHLTPPT